MKITRKLLLALLLACLGYAPLAQEDQLVVIEDLSKSELRKEIVSIEQELYQFFNDNNADADLEIKCQEFIRTGSHIPVQACEPKFMRDARAENANDSAFGIQELMLDERLIQYHAVDYQRLTEAMNALAKENPNFAQLVMILNKLNARLAQLER